MPDARAAMAPLADAFFGAPSAELRVVGVTGTNGKTTTAFLVARDPRRRRPPRRAARDGRAARRRARRARRADDARGDRPAAHLPPHARRRRPGLRDGGLVDRARAGRRRRHALRRRRLHEPQRRTTSTSTARWRTTSPPRPALRRPPPGGGRTPTTRGGGSCAPSSASPSTTRTPRCAPWPSSSAAAGPPWLVRTPRGQLAVRTPLRGRFNVDNVLCAIALALLVDAPDDAIAAGLARGAGAPGRFEPVDGRPALHRGRRLRAHARRARDGAGLGPRDDARAG